MVTGHECTVSVRDIIVILLKSPSFMASVKICGDSPALEVALYPKVQLPLKEDFQ